MSKPKIYTSLYHDHNGGALIVIFQRVPIKNFGNDIRASSDVEHFVKQATLFLDLDETNLEAILDTMLEKLIELAGEEYDIDIKKNSDTPQSSGSTTIKRK